MWIVSLRLNLLQITIKERAHLQEFDIITTRSATCILFSSLRMKSCSSCTKITDLHSERGSSTKMILILTQTWKGMWPGTHMSTVKIGTTKSVTLFALHCLWVCVSLSKLHVTCGFHSSDASGCPKGDSSRFLQWRDLYTGSYMHVQQQNQRNNISQNTSFRERKQHESQKRRTVSENPNASPGKQYKKQK